jgi:glycerol-3-phosphate dehydrogenase
MSGTSNKCSPGLEQLQVGVFDLLVIGGGIVGAGIVRDAAMRGLRAGLVEQNDFASGTSSRSSRLLHGGIRYLAQARIGLVREASIEKTVIHRIAPHLADPLAFIFPTRKNSSWSRWKLAFGVKLYDLLCGRRNLGKSRVLSRDQTLSALPGLDPTALTGAVRYYDGLTNDARLTLDTLRSAQTYGASLCNYAGFLDAVCENKVWRCEVEQVETNHRIEVKSKCLVNATGPWSHQIPHSQTKLRLTKGVHLVVDRTRLPVPDAVVLTEHDRILFAIPWGERVILGTTDTDFDGPIDSPTCDRDDVQYVLDVVNESFPSAHLTQSDVLSKWAGLRPLVADRRGNPSDISRRHEVKMSHLGWWDVTGGKLTTYRRMAEDTVDAVVCYLGVSRPACTTATVPLLTSGAAATGASGILPPTVTESVVKHYCHEEWAAHLDDVMIRRTSWRYYHTDHLAIAESVARWMSGLLGWTDDVRHAELARYRRLTSGNETSSPHFPLHGPQSVRHSDAVHGHGMDGRS